MNRLAPVLEGLAAAVAVGVAVAQAVLGTSSATPDGATESTFSVAVLGAGLTFAVWPVLGAVAMWRHAPVLLPFFLAVGHGIQAGLFALSLGGTQLVLVTPLMLAAALAYAFARREQRRPGPTRSLDE